MGPTAREQTILLPTTQTPMIELRAPAAYLGYQNGDGHTLTLQDHGVYLPTCELDG